MNPASQAALLLRRAPRAYARAALADLERRRPGFVQGALPPAFPSPESDLEVRILQLAEAVAFDAGDLFADAVAWYRTALASREVADDYLKESLRAVGEALARELPPECFAPVERILQPAMAAAQRPPERPPSPIEQQGPFTTLAQRFLLAVLEGRGDDAIDMLRAALDQGATVAQMHDHVLIPSQHEVGRMWMLGEAPIADEHYASQVAAQALVVLQQRIARPRPDAPHVMAFGVAGNLHDLGIKLIAQRLQSAGYRVTTLGSDMPASDLPWAIADRPCDLLACSAAMLLHLGQARAVVEVRDKELGGKPPILVGGGPFLRVPDLHLRLGAEAGAGTAEAAVAAALRLAPLPA